MEDGLARRLAVAIPGEFLKSGGCPAYASVRIIKVETGEILQTAVVDARGDESLLLKPGMEVLACKLSGASGCSQVAAPPEQKKEEEGGLLRTFRKMGISL